MAGISGGASTWAAIEIAKKAPEGSVARGVASNWLKLFIIFGYLLAFLHFLQSTRTTCHLVRIAVQFVSTCFDELYPENVQWVKKNQRLETAVCTCLTWKGFLDIYLPRIAHRNKNSAQGYSGHDCRHCGALFVHPTILSSFTGYEWGIRLSKQFPPDAELVGELPKSWGRGSNFEIHS